MVSTPEIHPVAARSAWSRDTNAGRLGDVLGIPAEVPRADVDQHLENTREVYRERFKRELTETEVAHVRLGAEIRSARTAGPALEVPELVERMNATYPGAGWRWSPEFGAPGAGIAVLQDGRWQGDPDVAARAEQAGREKAARLDAIGEARLAGPMVMRTVAPPT